MTVKIVRIERKRMRSEMKAEVTREDQDIKDINRRSLKVPVRERGRPAQMKVVMRRRDWSAMVVEVVRRLSRSREIPK
jgi:hypothetical protein